jgi:hypothetical protein
VHLDPELTLQAPVVDLGVDDIFMDDIFLDDILWAEGEARHGNHLRRGIAPERYRP